jgi:hypothetical protein
LVWVSIVSSTTTAVAGAEHPGGITPAPVYCAVTAWMPSVSEPEHDACGSP